MVDLCHQSKIFRVVIVANHPAVKLNFRQNSHF